MNAIFSYFKVSHANKPSFFCVPTKINAGLGWETLIYTMHFNLRVIRFSLPAHKHFLQQGVTELDETK